MFKYLTNHLAIAAGILLNLAPISRADQYGPAGGNGGRPFYYVSRNGSFTEIIIRSNRRIDSLQFITGDRTSSIYGGRGGDSDIIGVGNRCIVAIRGTSDIATHKRKTSSIFSLEFIFSDGSSTGRYGKDGSYPFLLSAPHGEEIIGFFGRHGSEIDAIGIVTGTSRCS